MCSGKALRTQFWEDEAGRQWEARFRDGVGAGGTRNRVLPNPVGGFCFPVYDEERTIRGFWASGSSEKQGSGLFSDKVPVGCRIFFWRED